MTTQTSAPDPLAERMSRLEGAYEHLATKADLARLEARFEADIARLEARIAQMEVRLTKWDRRRYHRLHRLRVLPRRPRLPSHRLTLSRPLAPNLPRDAASPPATGESF